MISNGQYHLPGSPASDQRSVDAHFREIARRAVLITLAEYLLAGTVVTGGMLYAGQPWTVAILLGAISMETAAASTMMVIRECNSKGALTEILTGIIALNNICCLICYSLAAAAIDLSSKANSQIGLGRLDSPNGLSSRR